MASKYTLVDKRRWPGVYFYESSTRRHNRKQDVCYVINYKLDGKLKWEKIGWRSEGYTPQIAAELRGERLLKARHGETVKTHKDIRREKAATDRTLDDIAEAYFESKKTDLSKDGYRIDKGRYDNYVAAALGKKPVSSFTPADIEQWKGSLRGLSTTSVWAILEILRRIMNYGVRMGMCPRLSFQIELPKKDNERVEYLEPEQMRRLLGVLETWRSRDVVRMLRLAMVTGMRRGEIFKLENHDVDFHQNLIVLRRPKGGKTVSIPMNAAAREVLQEQMAWRDETMPNTSVIFPGPAGEPRQNCTAVARIKKKAGLPENFRIFHGLRHHYAVTLANSGEFSLDMIGQLLTHKSMAMTKRYAQFLPETMKQASERAAELIGTK